ncbi:MAG: hypothetical protein EPGJADBJ_02812 [Saprospiraceae bacterium]|nr:hypothetical protein [Saprospiraceae bacterium]
MPKSATPPPLPAEYAALPRITFPGAVMTGKSGHDFLWSFYHWACQYRDCTILLDFSGLTFFEGNLSALLLALAHKLKCECNLRFECYAGRNHNGMDLLMRNGLYGLLADQPGVTSPDYQQSTVQAKFFQPNEDDAFFNYIETELLGHRSLQILPGDLREWLQSDFFVETFTNIRVHSNSTLPFAACGQYFPKKGKMHFSICDLGDGFFKKIHAYTSEFGQPITEPIHAIEWALSGGSTQRRQGGNALKNILERCRENGHGLTIVTDGLIWELKNGKIQCRSLREQVFGTSIHIVFQNL